MKKLILVLAFCCSGQFICAQLIDNLNIGLESNGAWYNDDRKTGPFFDDVNNDGDKHIRFNNYLKLDYSFLKNFTASVQVESYEPFALINYSPNYEGTNIGTYSLNYKTSKLDVTAGHYYAQFGSGLILRNWEDRQLGINNALFGGKVNYNPTEYISLTALYGKQRVGFDLSEGEIFGFNTVFDVSNVLKFDKTNINLDLSYVGRKEATDIIDPKFNELTNAFSSSIDFSYENFYSSIEFTTKGEDLIVQNVNNNSIFSDDFIKSGNALLINAGYSKPGFGLNATLRRLENMSFYSDRKTAGNLYFENIVNFVPALTKQHDYLLTNIFVYQPQGVVNFTYDAAIFKVGEIGGQIDFYYNFKKNTALGGKYGTKIAINGSYWAGLKGDISTDFNNPDYDMEFLGFGSKYFSDLSLEVRKKWNKKLNSIFYYVNQYANQKEMLSIFSAETVKTNILVAESTYKFGKGKSVRFEAQKLWSNSDNHDWIGGTLEYNFNSKFSVYINDIYNKGTDKDTEKTDYYNFGGSFTKGATRIGLNYGRQRAGLVCVGGVCRFVPEATGLTMNLTTSF